MSEYYQPPFTMTEEITNLVIEIGEQVGAVVTYDSLKPNPTLRRESRIRSIHSSLAIEQNTLTLEQVSDVIDGKRVLGPPQDIREVKNAYEVYERMSALDPYNVKNLLLAHRIMMDGTPANYVPELISQLFTWMKQSKMHPLVKSCIFHYEFEFIHPFADGNGRMGRLWQSLILQKWRPFFAWLPIETLIHENQDGYYGALNVSNVGGESTAFVTFMLRIIRDALDEIIESQDANRNDNRHVGTNVGINVGTNEEKVLLLLKQDGNLTARTLAGTLGLTQRQIERILAALKKSGRLIRHGASKNGFWEVIE